MNTQIILVRHGESMANAKKMSQGKQDEWIDTHLTEKGREEAEKVALRLKKEKIDIIYSSDLKRAKETAEAINKFHNVKIKLDIRLRDILNGELLEDFVKKCADSFKEIENEDKNVLVVAHGSSVLTLLGIISGSKEEGDKIVKENKGKYGNTYVSLVEKNNDKYEIKLIGCRKHLDD
ncbi:histidine phosphatase family protein [Candidatus Pacearchaeota archaeon]|nr:histidine phosphatase family protein [Candidatus Pacearchaeota archaeon]